MRPLQALAPDQRAILELLLRQGRSYPELSEMLGLPEAGVRRRAHAALAALAPHHAAPIGEDGAVADWLLGQQRSDEEADRTAEAIARMPAWRAWACELTDRLAEIDGAEVPAVPEAEVDGLAEPRNGAGPATAEQRGSKPSHGAEPAATGGSSGPQRPASRVGGALLIGLLAALVAAGLYLIFSGRDEAQQPAADATATAASTATPQVIREIPLRGVGNPAQGLMRVFRRDRDGRLVFALAADGVPPNRAREVYAVWFTKRGAAPRNLGFSQTQVGEEGVFTTGGPQQGQEAAFARWLVDYERVVVARAGAQAASAEEPGRVVLRGTLPGGQ